MTGTVHNGDAPASVAPDPSPADPVMLAAQRRRARRTALVLAIATLCVYLGFILATGLRN